MSTSACAGMATTAARLNSPRGRARNHAICAQGANRYRRCEGDRRGVRLRVLGRGWMGLHPEPRHRRRRVACLRDLCPACRPRDHVAVRRVGPRVRSKKWAVSACSWPRTTPASSPARPSRPKAGLVWIIDLCSLRSFNLSTYAASRNSSAGAHAAIWRS